MDSLLFSATMKCMLLQQVFAAIWSKNKKTENIGECTTYQTRLKYENVWLYLAQHFQDLRANAKTWWNIKHTFQQLYSSSGLCSVTSVNYYILALTSKLLHYIEVLQVEKLSNPRVIGEVVHCKANHRIALETYTMSQVQSKQAS